MNCLILPCPGCFSSQTTRKMYHQNQDASDCHTFQEDISKLQEWADKWLLRFHPDKCKLMTIGRDTPTEIHTMYSEDKGLIPMANVQSEKDVGVIFDLNMSFREDINSRATKANSIMGIIRRTYTYLDIESFKLLFKSLVRPHLENGAPIRNPQLKRDITDLENVHRRATRQIPALKGMSYQNDCGEYAYQHCVIGGWGVTWLKPTSYCTMYTTLPCQACHVWPWNWMDDLEKP